MTRKFTRALLIAAVLGSTAMAGCTSTATKQSAGEVVDDGVVTAKLKAKLVDDPVTKAHQINVASTSMILITKRCWVLESAWSRSTYRIAFDESRSFLADSGVIEVADC